MMLTQRATAQIVRVNRHGYFAVGIG
jgi:hypothetical protein